MSDPNPASISILRSIDESTVSHIGRLHERVTALYEVHRTGIYRFLVTHGLPPAVAQEVAQDVFVRLFVALRDGREIRTEQGWLYGVAAKAAVDYWRRERGPALVELDSTAFVQEIESRDPNPEIVTARRERLRRVTDALLKLPKEQRVCIQLRSEGLRYREIAEILGVAVSTTAEWLAIAVERLRGAARD